MAREVRKGKKQTKDLVIRPRVLKWCGGKCCSETKAVQNREHIVSNGDFRKLETSSCITWR